jgi:hypothetical protein
MVMDALMGGGGGLPPEIPDPEAPAAPPAGPTGGGNEVDTLKTLITMGRDYTAIPTVTEKERLQMEKCLTIFQQLLAENESMANQLTGADPALQKALGPAA